jgi:hypothetical protein
MAARKAELEPEDFSPRVMGVDTARGGKDFTRMIDRKGNVAGSLINEQMNTDDEMVIADRIAYHLRQNQDIKRVFIDTTSYGGGAYNRLCQLGFSARVSPIGFGTKAIDPEKYSNRRSEIWGRMMEWFKGPTPVSIPDEDDLHQHISAPSYRYEEHGGSRLLLEKKESIKKRRGFSPDGGDALALTFAEDMEGQSSMNIDYSLMQRLKSRGGAQSWMSM